MTGSVVIVGAGHAGGRTAQALRRLGFTGPICVIGEEPSPPYERPALSKDLLLGRVTPESLFLLSRDAWHDLGVELRLGVRVTGIEPAGQRLGLADGGTVEYDRLVLATGARARTFPVVPDPTARLHYLRTMDDALQLRRGLLAGQRLTVIGAGFIGLELAASATQLGVKVTLVESANRPLARLLPPGFAHWMAGLHAAHGVDIRLNRAVVRIGPGRLWLDDGARLDSDCVAVGIGARPNDELARAAGLAVRDGVIVDDRCRTSDAAIYAVGDVARRVDPLNGVESRIESWRNAEDQALKVASVLCGIEPPRDDPPWFWSDQYGRNIQLAGWPAEELTLVERGDADAGPYLGYFLQGPVLRGVIGVDCGREVRSAQRLIHAATAVEPASLPGPGKRKAKQVVLA
jgi:3-phenylpropionate/trans-cinnamate dioxygenase ferredoxin reductase component